MVGAEMTALEQKFYECVTEKIDVKCKELSRGSVDRVQELIYETQRIRMTIPDVLEKRQDIEKDMALKTGRLVASMEQYVQYLKRRLDDMKRGHSSGSS